MYTELYEGTLEAEKLFFFFFFFKHGNFDDLHVDRETEDLEYSRLMGEGTISMLVSTWMNVAMDP